MQNDKLDIQPMARIWMAVSLKSAFVLDGYSPGTDNDLHLSVSTFFFNNPTIECIRFHSWYSF